MYVRQIRYKHSDQKGKVLSGFAFSLSKRKNHVRPETEVLHDDIRQTDPGEGRRVPELSGEARSERRAGEDRGRPNACAQKDRKGAVCQSGARALPVRASARVLRRKSDPFLRDLDDEGVRRLRGSRGGVSALRRLLAGLGPGDARGLSEESRKAAPLRPQMDRLGARVYRALRAPHADERILGRGFQGRISRARRLRFGRGLLSQNDDRLVFCDRARKALRRDAPVLRAPQPGRVDAQKGDPKGRRKLPRSGRAQGISEASALNPMKKHENPAGFVFFRFYRTFFQFVLTESESSRSRCSRRMQQRSSSWTGTASASAKS